MNKKENKGSVIVGNVHYHEDHIKDKETFKSIFGNKKDWEDRYKKVVAAKKKL